jgi:L-alanine-DL-glutamate epimerase-like enolase superfamily enzyme
MTTTALRALRFSPLDVPLREPFGIATGAQVVAANVLVRVELADGTVGLGEAAPFPAVSGETQAEVLAALPRAALALEGHDAARYRPACAAAREALAEVPSALCAVEMAILDALCRSRGISLWSFFGGAEPTLLTDITITTGDVESARASALRARQEGFTTLKIKIGAASLDGDAERVRAVHAVAPNAELILDANAALSAQDALRVLAALGPARDRVALFEQPTARDDLEGLAQVERDGRVPVAADESARGASEVARIARLGAASVINVKTAKTGLIEAWDMIATAKSHGLGLMIGGMVETELSMSASACLAAGIGGFRFVDLDTPLFMGPRPLRGGFAQRGPHLDLTAITLGHGVEVTWH